MHPQSLLDYFARIGAEVLNFRRAMVKSFKGHYYVERALIKITNDGDIVCTDKELAPTEEEAARIKVDLANCDFPKTIGARNIDGLREKKGIATESDLYEFIDRRSGLITMVQERRINRDGTKSYPPWTFLSTGEWISMEPDGALPFWKPREGRGPGAQIMIHEGAKAAAVVDRMLREDGGGVGGHPWARELSEYEHWGMIGGALAPHRTDYEELRRESPSSVVYVCDNDHPGTEALQKVSQCWGKSLKGIVFGNKFDESWDMADEMPEKLFSADGKYLGPAVHELMEPATWATEVLPAEKGRGLIVLKNDFIEEWIHCVTPEVFIHRDWPDRIFNSKEFDSKVGPFSKVDETSRLMKKRFSSKAAVLRYEPGEVPGVHGGSKDGIYINTFSPSKVMVECGDERPWLDFMEMLVPEEIDRLELMRWVATLIARPGTRMLYGVLLISEAQGVGKGTLGEKILAPLVGEKNVSYPSEQEIVDSNYNYWLAHKRLAVVHEIYAGHSSKAYNKLKSAITDRFVTVQKKYQANYEIENWVHVFACSNSLRAMKLTRDDRRWFLPRVTEEKRPQKYWEEFNGWLIGGGLGIIKRWAEEFLSVENGVRAGDPAPWSGLKKELVEEGYSPGQAIVAQALEDLEARIGAGELCADTFVIDRQLVSMIRNELYEGRHNEKLERPLTVRTIAKSLGWAVGKKKIMITTWGKDNIGGRIISRDAATAHADPVTLGGEKVAVDQRRRPFDVCGGAL